MPKLQIFLNVLLLISFVVPNVADAATVNLSWRANNESDLAGYRLYYGTSPRIYGPAVPVGKVTQYSLTGLDDGQTYYFAITAVDTSGNESGYSQEISRTFNVSADTASPTTDDTTAQVEMQEDRQTFSSVLEQVLIAYRQQRKSSARAAQSQNRSLASTKKDTVKPDIHITAPTNMENYATDRSGLSVSGIAADNLGISQITWQNSAGGNGTATGTQKWTIPSLPLRQGLNLISVTAVDYSGNRSVDSILVTYRPKSSTGFIDTTAPEVAIISPTTESEFSTSHTRIELAGTAADNTEVLKVLWTTASGAKGVAEGTQSWMATGIPLIEGQNTITVTAVDAAANVTERSLTVVVTPDTSRPELAVTTPTNMSIYKTTQPTIDLGGVASDDQGLSRITWRNAAGAEGIASGTEKWTIEDIPLVKGANRLTISAFDTAGNASASEITVDYIPK